jgi:hypothetical protein
LLAERAIERWTLLRAGGPQVWQVLLDASNDSPFPTQRLLKRAAQLGVPMLPHVLRYLNGYSEIGETMHSKKLNSGDGCARQERSS